MQDKSGISAQALSSLALVRRLVRDFIWRYASWIAFAFVCMGIAAASTALRAWLMEPVLDRIFIARDASLLLLLGGAALVLAFLKGFADYGQTVLMNRVGQRVIADVQKALFARLIRADLSYFNATSSGLLISRLTNDVGQLRSAAANVLAGIGRDAITVVFLVLLMFYQDWLLALIAFFAFPLSILPANLQEGLAAAQRVFQVLDIEPAIRDMPEARPLRVSAGEVRFKEVRFGYHPAALALDGISLTVPGGGTVALVGPSGAGKSTMLNLIPRFYEVDQGAISIDGQDVRAVTLESLRASIALVAQEVSLFDDTVRANIAYGRSGASQSDIEAAAAAAGADHFIRELPESYDTVVGEHGMLLSGAQRQRLAIARAMLRDAPILLLDEATSALDGESERQVQTALRSLMKGRTTIVIAHRLSTVIGADLICVLDRKSTRLN